MSPHPWNSKIHPKYCENISPELLRYKSLVLITGQGGCQWFYSIVLKGHHYWKELFHQRWCCCVAFSLYSRLTHIIYPASPLYFKVFLQPSALLKPPGWNDNLCPWLNWISSGRFPTGRNSWMVKQTFVISWILFTENITVPGKCERGKNGQEALTYLPQFGSHHGGTAVKHKHHILG